MAVEPFIVAEPVTRPPIGNVGIHVRAMCHLHRQQLHAEVARPDAALRRKPDFAHCR